MSYLTTKKEIVRNTAKKNLIKAGYCELQYLLKDYTPLLYTRGYLGWNFNVYILHGKTICTGYRGMPGRLAKNAKEYDEKAMKIWNGFEYEVAKIKVDELLKEFLAQA